MEDNGILNIRFNAACDCFALAMQSGIRIYNLDPPVKLLQIDAAQIGSVYMVEMLHRSNLIGFVSGGKTPKFAENAVILYDLVAKMPSFDYLVPLPVVAFRLSYASVVVLTMSEIYIFSLSDSPTLLYRCATADNPQGVCDVACIRNQPAICVFPAPKIGALHVIMDLEECAHSLHTGASFTPASIAASQSAVAAVALSYDGRFLATASVRGTLIRLWSLGDRQRPLLVEFRRGAEAAKILSLAFAPPTPSSSHILLVAASDTGTAHVFVHASSATENSGGNGSPRGGPRQRHSILSSAARVVAATTVAAGGGSNAVSSSGALSPSSRVSQLLDACRFSVGAPAAKATRLVSHTHAVALSPDGKLQRFAIIPADGVARSDIVDTFIEHFDEV